MTTPDSLFDKFLISFWGTRGSISTPGRSTEKYGGNTPCISLSHQDTRIILDAGTGIRNLGLELVPWMKEQEGKTAIHLFLSHTHWDHIQGLPFFQPAYMEDTQLIIHGSPKKESFLESVLRGQMDVNYFPVEMSALAATVSIEEMTSGGLCIDGIKIDWQEQHLHPGGSVRYRFSIGEKSIVYATDVELDLIFAPDGMPLENATEEQQKMARDYSAFIAGVDLLIADGQYTRKEYAEKKHWGHTSVDTLLAVAHRAGVKELAVFHHEPLHADEFLDELWRSFAPRYNHLTPPMNVFWAREGLTLAVGDSTRKSE